MQHHVRTAEGTSIDCIQQSPQEYWSGVCQGSAAAGTTWIAVESIILEAYSKMTKINKISGPGESEPIERRITGYVNDKNINICYPSNHITRTEMKEDIEYAATTWDNLLNATGGELSPEKCYFYIVQWIWNKGNATMKQCDKHNNPHYLHAPKVNRAGKPNATLESDLPLMERWRQKLYTGRNSHKKWRTKSRRLTSPEMKPWFSTRRYGYHKFSMLSQ